METSSFYMTLPSNASMDVYPDNTCAEYKIRTPRSYYLKNQYEVGLSEIQYPHTWETFRDSTDYKVSYRKVDVSTTETVTISAGHYKTIPDLIDELNREFVREFKDEEDIHIRFSYNAISRTVKMSCKNIHSVYISMGLAQVLGFDERDIQQ